AAILADVGLAIAVGVVTHRDAIRAGARRGQAEAHRPGPGRRLDAVEPTPRLQPVRLGAAIELHADRATGRFDTADVDAHGGAGTLAAAHVVADLLAILRGGFGRRYGHRQRRGHGGSGEKAGLGVGAVGH